MHRTCPSQSVTKLMHYVDDTGVREQTTSPCDKLVTRRAMAGCRDQNGHVGGVVERLSIFRAMRDAIMVGTEGEGTAPPGYSVFVIMSMLGPHQSLNVVTALMVALDELYADGSGIVSYLSNDDIPQT